LGIFFLPTNMRKWWNLPNTLQFDTQMEDTGCTTKLTGQLVNTRIKYRFVLCNYYVLALL
jgi:hypothetical protein